MRLIRVRFRKITEKFIWKRSLKLFSGQISKGLWQSIRHHQFPGMKHLGMDPALSRRFLIDGGSSVFSVSHNGVSDGR